MVNEIAETETGRRIDESALVGSFRTIGETGPLYEVLSVSSPGELRIEVVHSGEIVDYPTKEAAEDPIAR